MTLAPLAKRAEWQPDVGNRFGPTLLSVWMLHVMKTFAALEYDGGTSQTPIAQKWTTPFIPGLGQHANTTGVNLVSSVEQRWIRLRHSERVHTDCMWRNCLGLSVWEVLFLFRTVWIPGADDVAKYRWVVHVVTSWVTGCGFENDPRRIWLFR